MARRTLIDFFEDLGNISGEFLVFDDGYRSWSYSYRDTADRAHAFAGRLHAAGITRGQIEKLRQQAFGVPGSKAG